MLVATAAAFHPQESVFEPPGENIREREASRVVQLPMWPEPVRGTPNSILRSALFPAIKPSDRKALTRKILASHKGVTVRFTGIQFSQSDLDVWEEAVHIARHHPLGTECHFTAHAFLTALERDTGSSQHEWLKDVVSRLTSATVEITHEGNTYGGHLIDEFYRDEHSGLYRMILNKKILSLYDAGYTQTRKQHRKALRRKPLAQWLSGYYSSHRKPYPLKVETLHALSGSNATLKKFKQNLAKALDELVTLGILTSWKIEAAKVYVERPTVAIEHNP